MVIGTITREAILEELQRGYVKVELIGMMLVIKFLRMNSHLGQLTDTFVLMMEGLTHFMLVLLLVLVVFTSIGMMLFGSKLSIFADPIRALDTTVGFVMGFSDTQLLFDTDAPAALIFYVPFVFVMIFFIDNELKQEDISKLSWKQMWQEF